MLRRIPSFVGSGEGLFERSRELLSHGFRPLDALHLACAEMAKCDYLVTCDDKLLASASRAGERIRVRVIDPLSIAAKLETEEKS